MIRDRMVGIPRRIRNAVPAQRCVGSRALRAALGNQGEIPLANQAEDGLHV